MSRFSLSMKCIALYRPTPVIMGKSQAERTWILHIELQLPPLLQSIPY